MKQPDIERYWKNFLAHFPPMDSAIEDCLRGAFFCGAASTLEILVEERAILPTKLELLQVLLDEIELEGLDKRN